jgi:ferritin-like protein
VPDTDRTSIRTFQRLYELSSTRDALTKALVLAMLRQAVAAEQELSA